MIYFTPLDLPDLRHKSDISGDCNGNSVRATDWPHRDAVCNHRRIYSRTCRRDGCNMSDIDDDKTFAPQTR